MPKEKSLLNSIIMKYILIFVVIFAVSFFVMYGIYSYMTKNLTDKLVTSYKRTIISNMYSWLRNMELTIGPKEEKTKSMLNDTIDYLKDHNFIELKSFFLSLKSKYNMEANYYIISPEGVIEYTNYSLDEGFDFSKKAPNIWVVIKNLKPGQRLISPISVEGKTGYTRQYVYYKLKNGYILEIGILLKKTYSFLTNLVNEVKSLPFVKNYDVLFRVKKDFYKSLLTKEQCKIPKVLETFKSEEFTFTNNVSRTSQTIYLGIYDRNLDFRVYAKADLDFTSIYSNIIYIFYVVLIIFLTASVTALFLIIFASKKILSVIADISLKLKNPEYSAKPLEKTTIKEINEFIDSHNSMVKVLKDSIEEQQNLNQLLMNTLEEVDKQKKKYEELFDNIPNPAVKLKSMFGNNGKIQDCIVLDYNKNFSITFPLKENLNNKSLKTYFESIGKKEIFDYIVKYFIQPSFNGFSSFEAPIFLSRRWFKIFSHVENENEIIFIFADIDETKKMQIKLQENERRLQIAINAAEEAIWEYNYKTDSFFLSGKGWEMLGYEPQEMATSLIFWKTILYPEDRKRFLRIERKIVEGKLNDFRMLLRYKTKNENYKWIESVGEVINRDENGLPIKLIGIRRDVDKKKRTDDLIKKAERRYRQLMNNSIDAIAVYEVVNDGNDFVFIDFNQKACKIEGYNKRQVIGHSLKELFPNAVKAGFLEVLKGVYKTSKSRRYMLHYVDEKGNEVWRDNYIYKLSSGEIVAVYQDVTQEKLNQRTINILSLALQKSKNIICITDDKCNLIWVDKEFESVTGYSLKDVTGKNVWSIYDLSKKQLKEIYNKLKGNDFWKGELKFKAKDKWIWERSFISLIREDGKVVNVVKVGEDITKEKEMEERLKEYANIDELTKVLNRRAGYLLLETEAKKAKRKKIPLVVAFIDMDNLKKINDNFGHEKGDEFILKMVEILKSSVRDTDSIMRIGGDEFVIVFPESTIQDVEYIFKERILKKIDEYNSKSDFSLPLGLSYGLAEYNNFDSDFDIEEMLKMADSRMYEMKARKKVLRD